MSDMLTAINNSVKGCITEKINSPFYGTFLISWCLWNWKVFYITLFIDSRILLEEKSTLKIDYITSYYSWYEHFWYTLLHVIILPLGSTFFIVYIISLLASIFYDKSLSTRNHNELIALNRDRELLKVREEKLTITKDILETQKEEKQIIEATKTEEQVWEEEYKKFRFSGYFDFLKNIETAIYRDRGRIENMNPQFKAYYDLNEIAIFTGNNVNYDFVELTTKGRYFLKLFKNESTIQLSDL